MASYQTHAFTDVEMIIGIMIGRSGVAAIVYKWGKDDYTVVPAFRGGLREAWNGQ